MNKRAGKIEVRHVVNVQALVVFFVLFVLFVVYLIGHNLSVSARLPVTTARVAVGAIEQFRTNEGVIIRNERVFRAGASGVPVWHINEGGRARVGDLVSAIHDANTVAQITGRIDDLNREAVNIQLLRGDLSLVEEDVRRVNNAIAAVVNEYSAAVNSGDFHAMYSLRDRIYGMFNERNNLLLNENRGMLSNNVALRNDYEMQLHQAMHQIMTDVSGIVSFRLDGMEGVLRHDRLRNLPVESTRQRIPAAQPAAASVETGEPVFKIITSNIWYIVSFIPRMETLDWFVDMRQNIYIAKDGGYERLETRVHVLENDGDYTYVVFAANSRLLDFLDMRSVVFRTESNMAEGLRIPNSAIAEHTILVIPNRCIGYANGIHSVTVIGENRRETQVAVTVTLTAGDYSYVYLDHNRLRFGDILLDHVNGGIHEITDGGVRVLRGVYVIRRGAAQFIEITLEGSLQSDRFTVLDRDLNRNIRVGDNVVTDVRNITDGQIVF